MSPLVICQVTAHHLSPLCEYFIAFSSPWLFAEIGTLILSLALVKTVAFFILFLLLPRIRLLSIYILLTLCIITLALIYYEIKPVRSLQINGMTYNLPLIGASCHLLVYFDRDIVIVHRYVERQLLKYYYSIEMLLLYKTRYRKH